MLTSGAGSPLQGEAGGRVFLPAGHGGDAVVEDDQTVAGALL